jgi:hypothetical protein
MLIRTRVVAGIHLMLLKTLAGPTVLATIFTDIRITMEFYIGVDLILMWYAGRLRG